MGVAKIIYGGETKIDLTQDSVIAEKLEKGYTAHDKNGDPVVGTNTFDVDSSTATATEAEVLEGKTFAKGGAIKIGGMNNNGSMNGYISEKSQKVPVPIGFHDGGGWVAIDPDELAKFKPENIRDGITLLGQPGSMTGTEGARPQSKTVTPSTSKQTVLPDTEDGYNFLSQVTVDAIPYKETSNATGGITITIG